MHDIDKKKILSRYAQRIETLGHGAAALGEPKRRQAFFFEILSQVNGFELSDSVIDVGCGYGDLFDFLKSKGWRGQYLGIDINPQLIDEGQRLYPQAELKVLDIQTAELDRTFDWCFCCQALTSETEAVPFIEHLESMLQMMWKICRKGLVFNLLSPLADFTHPVHARPNLASVMSVLTKITNRFSIRHDYMPFEFAVYLHKDNAVLPETNIFEAEQDLFAKVTARWSRSVR